MRNLDKQLLIRLSTELDNKITKAHSDHLKNTGEYISKCEFVRNILESNLK